MSGTMQDISVSAAKVRDITSVIESIAFQTNILALNAAVERGARRRGGPRFCRGGR
ncbi:methyl-accepting chemotaxis protein [Pantoea ananatis]